MQYNAFYFRLLQLASKTDDKNSYSNNVLLNSNKSHQKPLPNAQLEILDIQYLIL